jgi:hypothetical protein
MVLYYLKGDDPSPAKEPSATLAATNRRGVGLIARLALSFLILLTTILQLLPITWSLEMSMLRHLPQTILGSPTSLPSTRLLEVPSTDEGLSPLDVAMTLRGLGKLHPAEILIVAKIAHDPESDQLLKGVLNTIRAEGIEVLQAQVPAENSTYHSVPICRYTPPFISGSPLETIAGRISNKDQGCFLPSAVNSSQGIQLYAETSQGEVVESIWQELLKEMISAKKDNIRDALTKTTEPSWLIGGRVLIFPNHSALLLNEYGSVPLITIGTSFTNRVTQEDFLLGSEQKERGEKSPEFEALWNDALVIIAQDSDLPTVSTLHQLASRLVWRHLPMISQFVLGVGCVLLLLVGVRSGKSSSLILAAALVVVTVIATMITLRHGILIPWLPQMVTALAILGISFRQHSRKPTGGSLERLK